MGHLFHAIVSALQLKKAGAIQFVRHLRLYSFAVVEGRRIVHCLCQGELVRIATLINKLVDMDGWDEDQEQELFELSVSACLEVICKGLAPPHYDMLHTPRGRAAGPYKPP